MPWCCNNRNASEEREEQSLEAFQEDFIHCKPQKKGISDLGKALIFRTIKSYFDVLVLEY